MSSTEPIGGPLPSSWRVTTLGALCDESGGEVQTGPFGSQLHAEDYVADGIPSVMPKDIVGDRISDRTIARVSEADAKRLAQHRLRAGDIVYARRGDIGRRALVTAGEEGWLCGTGCLRIRLGKSDVAPEYLLAYLGHPALRAWVESKAQGATMLNLNTSILRAVPLRVPPLAEQRRIADILDKADAIRRKRKEAIALTQDLLRSAFLEMFGDPVTNPKGWPVKPLGELADAQSGVTKGKRYDGQTMVTLPYMRVANVQDGHLVLDEVKTIEVSEGDGRRYQLKPGDVLLTEGGDPDKLGRGAVWHGDVQNCIHQNHIFRVRPGREVRSEYLSAIIGSERGKRYFLRAAKQTTGIATINMTQLKAFPVLLPAIDRQDAYVRFMERARVARGTFRSRGDGIEDLFNSLVARAFSGGLSA